MYDDNIDYQSIRQRVIEKTQRRYRFIVHVVIFVLGLPIIGAISPFVFLIWVGAVVFHFLWLSYHHALETAIQQEVDSERERISKMKRDGTYNPVGVGDDGEFIHYYENDDDEYQAPYHR
jgi:hypothetical protein